MFSTLSRYLEHAFLRLIRFGQVGGVAELCCRKSALLVIVKQLDFFITSTNSNVTLNMYFLSILILNKEGRQKVTGQIFFFSVYLQMTTSTSINGQTISGSVLFDIAIAICGSGDDF